MKTLIAKSALYCSLVLAFLMFTAATPADSSLYRWELLGLRKVNYQLDRDQISVTLKEGVFNAVQFKIKRAGLNMHRCVIHFANGDTQNVALKKQFKPGSQSRVIDLKGRNRVIQKVVFWYDSKNNRPVKSVVQLWGK